MSLETLWKLLPWACRAARWLTRRKPQAVTFLVVEDDANDAELLQIQLRRRGIACEIATSAEVATGMVKHTFYPAILLDLRLPGMSGQTLLRVLSRDTPSTNAVIVCGEPRDLEDIPASRFICVIRKPATLDAIEDMLQKLKLPNRP